MNSLKVFENPEFGTVRVVEKDGELWFVAKDVAEKLGYSNPRKAVRDHCKNPRAAGGNESFLPVVVGEDGLDPQTLLINQSDVLRLIIKSDLPDAERVERWIFEEVIPSVLKTGGYIHAAPDESPEAILARAVLVAHDTLKRVEKQRKALEVQIEADKPKVVFADSISVSKSTILIGELAKLIKQATGFDVGQNRLFSFLRRLGYLHSHGSQFNMPTQRCIESGWMVIKEGTRIGSSGESHITKTTKITGKGQIYFLNLFRNMTAISC
jgi:anti-repressor protein